MPGDQQQDAGPDDLLLAHLAVGDEARQYVVGRFAAALLDQSFEIVVELVGHLLAFALPFGLALLARPDQLDQPVGPGVERGLVLGGTPSRRQIIATGSG